MLKVGILSMQRIANYGSFLQAYGLKCLIEELGAEAEFVDYHPGETLIPADGGTGLSRKFSKLTDVLKYKAPFGEKIRFIKYKKNYAANYYPYLGIGEQMNYTPKLDLEIIGSDEVFNCVQNNTNVGFAPELFGSGNNAGRLISYAASFGNTTLEKLSQYGVEEKVAEWLKRFDAISVRDKNSGDIIKNLTGKAPEYNLDPVLAYDFVGKCKEIPAEVDESDYMILYGYSGRFTPEECKAVRAYADSKGLKVFCIGGVQGCCDKFIDCDPFKVIAYFMHADCVVTDTFHGTILSVITRREFVSVVRNEGYGNSEKLTDLLERLGLNDRKVKDIYAAEKLFENKIDYSAAYSVIESERQHTKNYLRKELEACIQS